VDTNILEEHALSIFRVAICRLRNWLCYIGKLQERWSLRHMARGKELEPNLRQWGWWVGKEPLLRGMLCFLSQVGNGIFRKDYPFQETIFFS
jgi:hypothetical protein